MSYQQRRWTWTQFSDKTPDDLKESEQEDFLIQSELKLTNKLDHIKNNPTAYNGIVYMCACLERCPTTLALHVQGYLETRDKISRKKVKELLHENTAHLEKAQGTAKENKDYIFHTGKHSSKECKFESPFEWGTPRIENQGARTDLYAVHAEIKEGKTETEIAEAHFAMYCRYRNGIKALIDFQDEKLEKPYPFTLIDGVTVVTEPQEYGRKNSYLIIGPSDMHKSTWLGKTFANKQIFALGASYKNRYEGYKGQQLLFGDDIEWLKAEEIKKACAYHYFKNERVTGDPRFKSVYWPQNKQTHIIWICNTGKEPKYITDEWFTNRFNIIRLPDSFKWYPKEDPKHMKLEPVANANNKKHFDIKHPINKIDVEISERVKLWRECKGPKCTTCMLTGHSADECAIQYDDDNMDDA